MQRAKQSAKYGFDFCLFLAECQVIIEFSAKKRQDSAKAWQIASLVALATNEQVCFNGRSRFRKFEKFPKSALN